MSLPPEPPLLASPSPPVAQLPTPLARATGRRMARELRGHGGLNVFSVKTGAGSLRSAQDCLKFREGGFQPAAEESMACASATETLSKTRLKTSLHDLVSEPDFDSQLRSLRLFPRGHSRVLCVVTLWPTAPADTSCSGLGSHPTLLALLQPGSGPFPRRTSPTAKALQKQHQVRGPVVFSPPPALKVNQKHVLQMNAASPPQPAAKCHQSRLPQKETRVRTHTTSSTAPSSTNYRKVLTRCTVLQVLKRHAIGGFEHLSQVQPCTATVCYKNKCQTLTFNIYCLPVTTPATVWNLSIRHGSDHFHSFAQWHGKHITCRRKCHYRIYAFIIWQRFWNRGKKADRSLDWKDIPGAFSTKMTLESCRKLWPVSIIFFPPITGKLSVLCFSTRGSSWADLWAGEL